MKLGQKVKFNSHLKKRDRYDERMDNVKYKTLELDEPLEGYISGKRTIPYKGYSDQELGYHYFVPEEYKEVILVACNWSGFYRVPEEWLQEVEE
ncbi:hypothetical protein DFR79_13235 [Halanaerobium saccharolyticum]|jgi:hypothetical protein|uniref:Uncharacterized protein n=1 Tax=Halanaerobium saccharolyticum TaxID=43595 RepID=A0A4R6LH05_9FIRM|nr:hypothetical protein [Halanaerobium saccharolyticum]TDO77703.1 hypothetical protein DFR79_13235 [Halanaerobium saccharolyticum]